MTTPINWKNVTACGECCEFCQKRKEGICKGCVVSDGYCEEWTQSGRCPIHACASAHQVPFCGLCGDFPCDWLLSKVTWKEDLVSQHNTLAALYRVEHTG